VKNSKEKPVKGGKPFPMKGGKAGKGGK